MNVIGVRVKIFEEERCIYKREIVKSDENDLKTLLRDLREVQSAVNEFLTTLIQQQEASGSAQNTTDRSTLDVESDSSTDEDEEEEEETQVNPKKCKLI
ncbi:hypothetical protein EAI_02596 [Harpegnathos saltator]|uniref:EKC/KEOPS complex subunit GON7 n=1 Tax=Harpegnathos saltator TaxID=610380 RepID=E2C812_HARSA|nr:hypothetical protein EAI_02596 [Harpegnathos saltator]